MNDAICWARQGTLCSTWGDEWCDSKKLLLLGDALVDGFDGCGFEWSHFIRNSIHTILLHKKINRMKMMAFHGLYSYLLLSYLAHHSHRDVQCSCSIAALLQDFHTMEWWYTVSFNINHSLSFQHAFIRGKKKRRVREYHPNYSMVTLLKWSMVDSTTQILLFYITA